MLRILLRVLLEGDEAGKGCDKCACAADVYTQQKLTVVVGELGEQNCRGHVGDKLTAHCREN